MKLSAPHRVVWIVAVVLGVLGLLGKFGVLSTAVVAGNAFWLVTIGFALLAFATAVKGA
jgi:hypothetical protein